jgi:PAS domain S-box-containing protein
MLISQDRQGEEDEILRRLRNGERIHHFETQRVRKDGTIIDISLSVSPVRDSSGTIVGAAKIARDISERKRGQESQQRLAAIVESSDDAIVSKTLEGIITSWNRGAQQVFGYTADEAIGQSILMLIPTERKHEEEMILSRIRRGERIEHFETERLRKDGSRINVSVTISPIRDSKGNVIGASKIGRDITPRIQTEAAIRRREEELASSLEQMIEAERAARSSAERMNVMKDEFLGTLSHELRTPLHAILGWSQLLGMNEDVDDELQEGLDAIERNARAQTQLIDDLLDMNRIVSGKIRLDVQRTDVAPVIEAAILSVRPSADAKGIRLRTILDPVAGPVTGDPARLQQVVWNLLTNAIKFTPKGGHVDVILERVNSHLEITVHDSGMGINPDFLPVVFERFRQGDSSTSRSFGGLGLGLSIVKTLVELHGGTVRAKSLGEGQGATFIVSLPLAALRNGERRDHPKAHSAAPEVVDCETIDLAGITVLVVDDEADARTLIERVLERCKAHVITASSAGEGLEKLKSERPDVLISDIGMPETDGYQFVRQVRKLSPKEGGRIPAIALTAFARTEDRTRAMMAGYNIHIAKPIEAQELLATVVSVTGRSTT